MELEDNPGRWVAAHHLFLQALSAGIRAHNPELIEHVRVALELSLAEVDQAMKPVLALALKLCELQPK
jgi:hypothetical protein